MLLFNLHIPNYTWGILAAAIAYAGFFFYFYKYIQHYSKLIEEAENMAKKAQDRDELALAYEKLKQAHKLAAFSAQSGRIREVKAIIDTKFKLWEEEDRAIENMLDEQMDEVFKDAVKNPESSERDARRLYTKILDKLKEGAKKRGDTGTFNMLEKEGNGIIENTMELRTKQIEEYKKKNNL